MPSEDNLKVQRKVSVADAERQNCQPKKYNRPRQSSCVPGLPELTMLAALLLTSLVFKGLVHALDPVRAWDSGLDVVATREQGAENQASTPERQNVFEVGVPLRDSFANPACDQVILDHEFAASYGSPYVGAYSPPADCNFTTVVFNMSVTSAGINYDRLGLLFLGDTEVWRTSTAMPTRTGIYWNVQKDMTVYDALLRTEQKVLLAIDNIYDSVFTAAWNVTITALYYDDEPVAPLTPADTILPLSSLSSAQNASSVFTLPGGNATLFYTLPRNAARAVVNVFASGSGDEEFWYFAVPSQFAHTFNASSRHPHGPFREVQVLVDGQLAGVAWPFPIVYTGGINPALWVPVVGVHTYDVPAYQVDITPWLGVLCDGRPHNFTLAVVGFDSTTLLGTVNDSWLVSGSIFVWTDGAGTQTKGSAPISSTPPPTFNLTSNVTSSASGTNTSLSLHLTGSRQLSHSATITTSAGPRLYTWRQDLAYANTQYWAGAAARNYTVYQVTSGSSSFTPRTLLESSNSSEGDIIKNTFKYPLSAVQIVSYPSADQLHVSNSSLYGAIDRSELSSTIPVLEQLTAPSVFLESTSPSSSNTSRHSSTSQENTSTWMTPSPRKLTTRQSGWAVEYWNNTYYEQAGAIDPARGSAGRTEQWYSFAGPPGLGGDREGGKNDGTEFGQYVRADDGYVPVLVQNKTYASTIAVPATTPLSLPDL